MGECDIAEPLGLVYVLILETVAR